MNGDLEWRVKLPSEDYEELQLDAAMNERGEESYRLFIPAYADKGKIVSPAQMISLTGPEFDELAATVAKFRKMKGAAV